MASSNHVGAFARTQWRKATHAANPRCEYCGCVTVEDGGRSPDSATVDHRQPLARGGLDRPDNFVLACYLCNQAKGSGRFTQDRRRQFVNRFAMKRMRT